MSDTLVDSNVVFTEDSRWFAWSAAALEHCADDGAIARHSGLKILAPPRAQVGAPRNWAVALVG